MLNIVTVGGGTGSYAVLSGLKNLSNISISAIVSMADDGGSTGILRRELEVHPMGDIRQCLAALTPNKALHNFMEHRFSKGNLVGHMSGNIFLAALEIATGSFEASLKIATKFLQPKGVVIPVTLDNAELSVLLTTGQKIEDESKINNIDFGWRGQKFGFCRRFAFG